MNNKSFTLIEILVIITIIGIVSAVIFVISNSAISSTQNARIKNDIDSLRKVILSYKAYYRLAPIEDPACNIGSDCSQLASDLLAIDPNISFPTNPSGGYYRYYSANGTTFTITADLPNSRTLVYDFQNGYSEYASLAGYTKRKSITVSNSGSTLTNYQMKFTVYRSAGTDSGFNVYLGTNCQSDYDDIHFTNSSNGALDYWIESSDASSATIWVEADSIAGTPTTTTMYLYYGNSSATAASNGDNTFIFFDDFLGNSLDTTTKWTLDSGSPVLTVGSGLLNFNSTNCSVNYRAQYGTSSKYTITEGKVRIISNAGTDTNVRIGNILYRNGFGITPSAGTNQERTPVHETIAWGTVANSSLLTSTWYILGLRYDPDADILYHNLDRGSFVSWASRTGNPTYNTASFAFVASTALNADIDWVLVRQYTATEPSISSWGTEESI